MNALAFCRNADFRLAILGPVSCVPKDRQTSLREPIRTSSGSGLPSWSSNRLMTRVSTLYASGPGWPCLLLYVTSHLKSATPASFKRWRSIVTAPFRERQWIGKREIAVSTRMRFGEGRSGCSVVDNSVFKLPLIVVQNTAAAKCCCCLYLF